MILSIVREGLNPGVKQALYVKIYLKSCYSLRSLPPKEILWMLKILQDLFQRSQSSWQMRVSAKWQKI